MYQLRYEHLETGNFHIYRKNDNKEIGFVFRLSDGRWFGQLALEGRFAEGFGHSAQAVVNEFEGWLTDGMPTNSNLLVRTKDKEQAILQKLLAEGDI